MTIAWIFITLGLIGLSLGFILVYNPLNMAQLSMNIFGNIFGGEKIKTKEHHQGFSLKWPWFKLQGKPIDMRSTIIITSGGILMMDWDKFISEKVYEKIAPRIYETSDSVLYGSWAAAIRPLKGELFNFMLKTPQVGALISMAKVDLTISDHVATKNTEEVLHNKKQISKIISKVFKGENIISEMEKSYGIMISDPELFDLNLGKKSQDAAERRFESRKFRESMEDLETQIADPDKRSNAIFIANGLVKKNIINIEGLENATKNIADSFASIFTKKS